MSFITGLKGVKGYSGGVIPPPPPSFVQWGKHLFVDPVKFNNPGTPTDLVYKYQTLDAAVAAASAGDVIWIINGSHAVAAGMWQNKSVTIYCEKGVTITGTNLNQDIVAGCTLLGWGVIVDLGIFLQAGLPGKGKLYFEAYSFTLSRIQCEGCDNLTIYSRTDITIDQYVQFYNNPYIVFWIANRTLFTNLTSVGSLSAFSMITQANSAVHIYSDFYANGVFTKILDLSGTAGNWTVDFRMGKEYTIYVNAIPTDAIVRSYNTYGYNTSLTNKKYNLRLDADIICNVNAYRAIWCLAGFLEYTGRIYSSSSAAGIIELNADIAGINQPATILLSKGCEIDANATGGVWTADGIIKCIGSANNNVIIDDLKLICLNNAMLAINSNVANTKLTLQGVARSNMALGGNMVNQIPSTTWTQETNITF